MNTFVLVACGARYIERAELCLKFLKQFCKEEVIVVLGDTDRLFDHDQVVRVAPEGGFDTVQNSRLIKTNLYEVLGKPPGKFCYLDSDAFVVSDQFSQIFSLKTGPITFAPDHQITVQQFSPFALCDGNPWSTSLPQAISETFCVSVNPDWRLWNGGLFLFDSESEEFLSTWTEYTRTIFGSPHWVTRDQATLIATIWKLGLEHQPNLPEEYNWLVRHSRIPFSQLDFEDQRFSYANEPVHLLHFIEGRGSGYGRTENWEWNSALHLLREREAV